ncbi:MAG: hypothetical protein IIC58_02065 [Proteobacteria bacterium]|nr:hypothetical protein [Pseudomonadota bacterium]
MCEYCGCGQDTFIRWPVAGRVANSSLGGIPVVAVAKSRNVRVDAQYNSTRGEELRTFRTVDRRIEYLG